MTEQEAFNNPEMKTIMLLSGYVRELSEGADYEATTYKLAETLVKVFVSQQSKLFFELLKFAMPTNYTDKAIKNIVDQFIDSKNCG
jgi:hypothetical protein